MNNLKYFETSVKTGHGKSEVFEKLYQDIYNYLQKELGLDKENLDIKNKNNKKTSCFWNILFLSLNYTSNFLLDI